MKASRQFHRVSVVLALALVGCAPMQDSRGGGQSSVVELKACGVRVTFSGNPKKMSADQIQEGRASLGEYYKWEVDGWVSSQFRLAQVAMCICRDSPFVQLDLEAEPNGFIGSTRRAVDVEGVGAGNTFYGERSPTERQRIQLVGTRMFPNCAVMQIVVSPPADDGVEGPFFSSLTSSTVAARQSRPTGNVADRLRQLEQLRKDGVISNDEYTNRRRVILDSL